MEKDFGKTYVPGDIETTMYDLWMEHDCFQPDTEGKKDPYCIIMPPPNITGKLHMGHAIFVAIQDLFTRFQRMRGKAVLWLPGTDHASIATQNVVEKEIAKEGLTRHQLGRERFLERVWVWVREYGQIITTQIRTLGASCDWSRNRFTMDERANKSVTKAFVELYQRDLIYKGKYLVNWCPRCQTVLADDEVEHRDEETQLYYIKYYLEKYSGEGERPYIVVATVRPETLLGDVAVAVHPSDPRYQNFVGQNVILPVANRPIPIIADRRADMKFGTGAVKITPAHDFNDYEIAREHKLPLINILNADGTMKQDMFGYDGMSVDKARKQMIKQLKEENLLEKTVDYSHTIGICYRCDTIIEPFLSTQWFVRTKPLAQKALQAVKKGEITFVPGRFTKVFNHWIENFRDWCISRQLWWGHQIPAWYCEDCLDKAKQSGKEREEYKSYTVVAEEEPTTCPYCGGTRLKRDPDVLDTWFSSGLWPFSTLGWPEQTEDLKMFYPTELMETGYDIIFFWIARMVILGLELMDDVPFRTVYLHGLVRDSQGRKMSKSLANVLDPLEIVEEFGADALRFSFLLNVSPGNDLKFSRDKVLGNRNFCNKLWNASRFVLSSQPDELYEKLEWQLPEKGLSLPDKWMLSRLHAVVNQTTEFLGKYNFGEAGKILYGFFWDEYCDWYLEMAKVDLKQKGDAAIPTLETAVEILTTLLKLLHPYIPFITEAIWQRLQESRSTLPAKKSSSETLLITSTWPQASKSLINSKLDKQMAIMQEVVQQIRNLRSELGIQQKSETNVYVVFPKASHMKKFFKDMERYILTIAPISNLSFLASRKQLPEITNALEFSTNELEVVVELAKPVDAAQRLVQLQNELSGLREVIKRSEKLLANKNFTAKAPEQVVAGEKQKLSELQAKHEILEKQVAYYEEATG